LQFARPALHRREKLPQIRCFMPRPADNRASLMFRAAAALILALTAPAGAQDMFSNRPAFSGPEQPPERYAECGELRAMAKGLPVPDTRIDLAVIGNLRLVKGDGALWYLVICEDLRVMCVTYQSNDMKVGERVIMRGGYRRLDDNHVVLDPCLASRDGDQPAQ
jgi:hypothetical protein